MHATGDTIVILTELPLTAADARGILGLHQGERLRYRVVVPTDVRRGLLVNILDHLSLLDLRRILDDLGLHHGDRVDPATMLERSLRALRTAGANADGQTVTDPPLVALGEAVDTFQAREVVVVTRPHAVEDTFHTDWASVARSALGVPVLHLYGGTDVIG